MKRSKAKRSRRPNKWTMTKWAPLPKSKAKDAYELVDEVCEAILSEPARYNQSTFGDGPKWEDIDSPAEAIKEGWQPHNVPACGTTCCYAGWVVVLARPRLFTAAMSDSNTSTNVPDEAERILGVDVDDLFTGSDILHPYLRHGQEMPRAGTMAYARLGVKRLRAFQKSNAAELKARKLRR